MMDVTRAQGAIVRDVGRDREGECKSSGADCVSMVPCFQARFVAISTIPIRTGCAVDAAAGCDLQEVTRG